MASRGSVLSRERAVPARALDRLGGSSAPSFRALVPVLVVLLAATAAIAAGLVWGSLGVGIGAVLAVGAVAAWVDVRCGRLPDALTATGAALAVATAGLATVGYGTPAAATAAAGCVALCLPLLVVHLAAPDAMGFGDVKLAALLGVAVGLLDWRWAVLALAIASGLTLIAAAATRRRSVPFGPGLVAGAATATLIASTVVLADGGPLGWGVATWR